MDTTDDVPVSYYTTLSQEGRAQLGDGSTDSCHKGDIRMKAKRFLGFVAVLAILTAGCGGANTRHIPSITADLSNLTVSAGTLTPAFSPDTMFYTVIVDSLQTSITITPTALNTGSTITVNGTPVTSGTPSPPIALSTGSNIVSIVVTASDTVTTKSYVVHVVKAYADADLINLVISQGALTPAFNPDITLYSVGLLADTVVSVTVTPTAFDSGATITVNGTPVASGTASSPISLSGAVTIIDIVVTASDGVTTKDYTVVVQKKTSSAYLKASNTGLDDDFGFSVSISGDTIVVGACGEGSNATGVNGNQADNSAPYSGAAYVFTRIAGVWSQQAYLKASNTGLDDDFGFSVSISGDTIVVGAPYEASNATGVNGNQSDNSASQSGAAYVFTRTAGVWSQQAYLKASNTEVGDWFGCLVSISGDTIVVGAPYEASNATGVNGNQADNSAYSAGAAYVFARTAGVWSQQAYLKASNTEAGDWFGCLVSISGDTIIVGAPSEDSNATGVNGDDADNSATNSGAAYVFVRTSGVWSQRAYLKASNGGGGDIFGCSVSISGDTIVVGAWCEASNATGINGNQADNSATDSGAAYVFTRTAGVWSQRAYLKASNGGGGDIFGCSVSISGDTIVVGASYEDSNATGVNGNQADNSTFQSGAAYVFTRTAGIWSQQAYLKASNTGTADLFGCSVSISGDTIVVGASGEDSNATGVNGDQTNNSAGWSGAAYVY
jgi:hypothetical protein